MRFFLSTLFIAAIALSIGATSARADTITYAFTGVLDDADNTEFSGSFSYVTDWGTPTMTLPNESAPIEKVWYIDPGEYMDWSLSFDGTAYARGDGDGYEDFLDIVNNAADVFAVGGEDDLGQYFEIWLQDDSGSALSSLSIPTSLDLADWDGYGDTYVYFVDAAGDRYYGELKSLSAVPEPATILLLGVGVLGLGLRRRRHA